MDSDAESHAGAVTPPPSGSPVTVNRAATAWNRPENGSVPVLAAPGIPIMDADSWPALPGLSSPPPPTQAQASPKAPPPPLPPYTGAVISPISLYNSGTPNANDDHDALVTSPVVRLARVMPAGDAIEKRSLGPELSPVYSPNTRGNSGGDHRQNGRFGSHPHGRGGSYGGGNRRGNGGGGGGRHGQDHHGNFDGQRRGGGRIHGPGHQHRGHQASYIRAPPMAVTAAAPPLPPPFVSPVTSHTPPYGAHMGFPGEMTHHFYYVAMPPSDGLQTLPFVPYPGIPPAMLISPSERLQNELLMQVEYYFSDDNLCKDTYLRQHMDGQGWVPLSLIAGFKQVKMLIERIAMVKKLTNSLQFILDTVLQSTVVEVQGERIRKREGWKNWPLPNLNYPGGSSSGSMSPVTSNVDSLASQFQSVGLEGTTYNIGMQGVPGDALQPGSATSVSAYQASSVGGPQNNRNGAIFGQNNSRSLLQSDTF